jgi:hypothetical protein
MSGMRSVLVWLAAAVALSACASRPAPAPAPERTPPVRQAPAPAAVAAPLESPSDDWRDRPLTPGDWTYESGEARYAGFSLRCDGERRQVTLSRSGASGPIRLRTSYGEHVLTPGAALPAADPRLDEIAFSRGRFLVETQGMPALVLPAWPEPARVVEDCRG